MICLKKLFFPHNKQMVKLSTLYDISFLITCLYYVSTSITISYYINDINIPSQNQIIRTCNDAIRNAWLVIFFSYITYILTRSFYCEEVSEHPTLGMIIRVIMVVLLILTMAVYFIILSSDEFQYVRGTIPGKLIQANIAIALFPIFVIFGGMAWNRVFQKPEISNPSVPDID